MSVGRICSRVVTTAAPHETVRAVADRMAEHNVGSVVVVEGGIPVGILTDRDLAVRVVATGVDAEKARADDVMTEAVRTLDESTPIEEALRAMKARGVRRLVVTGPEGSLAGVVTLDDVLELLVEEMEAIGAVVRKESPDVKGES